MYLLLRNIWYSPIVIFLYTQRSHTVTVHGCLSMSTDDSISEDVSSSVALSHDQISANGGKESEASIVSSEDTVSGLPEEEHSVSHPECFLQATEGANRPSTTPACSISNKIRSVFFMWCLLFLVLQRCYHWYTVLNPSGCLSLHVTCFRNLCLRTEEEFSSGRSLPFINPSSLETLRALVQEIQSSGETDPEIWKNCEVRWCPHCPFIPSCGVMKQPSWPRFLGHRLGSPLGVEPTTAAMLRAGENIPQCSWSLTSQIRSFRSILSHLKLAWN